MFELSPLRNRRNSLDPYLWPREFMKDFFGGSVMESAIIRADIRETENAYVVEAEMPGLNKENISLDWRDNTLIISAEFVAEKNEEKDHYLHRERRRGSYSRSFYIENVDDQHLQAKYEDGILSVTLPKSQPHTNGIRQITID